MLLAATRRSLLLARRQSGATAPPFAILPPGRRRPGGSAQESHDTCLSLRPTPTISCCSFAIMRRILRASEGRPQHEHEQHQQNIAEEGERKGNALEVEFDGTISTGNAPRQFFRKIPQRRKPAIPKVVVFDGPRGAPERAPISASLGPDVVRLLERSGAFARDDSGGREALEGYSRLRSRVGGTDIGGDHGGFGADPFGEMEDDDVDEEDRRDEQLQRLALDVCVVGEPNAGKSTLVNAMVGDQVSAVSPRAQTTRSEVLGVKTFMDYGAVELGDPEFLSRGPVTPFESGVAVQVVFRDTPGVVDPAARKKFSRSVVQAPYLALEELAELTAEDDDPEIRAQKLELYGKKALDEEIPSWQRTFVCLVVDAGRAEPTVREKHVVSELVKLQQKDPRLRVLCVLNKSDLVLHRCSGDRDAALDELKRRQRDIEESGLWLTETFSLSAKKQTGLRDLADYLRLKAVPAFNNEWEYEDPSITCGSSQVERVEDAVREQLFHHLEREVPYAVVQRNRQWVEMPPPSEILFIEQELLVSKGAQARMIVGKGGEKISEIRERANATILEFMGRPVELKLTVKVVSSSERQQTQLARDEV